MQKNDSFTEGSSAPARWARRILFLCAVLSIILLLFFWGGPVVVERGLTAYLERCGIDSPRLRVDSLSPRGVYLSDISVQQGRIVIDYLALRFSAAGLARGRIDRVVLGGLTWPVSIREGVVDAGLPAAERKDSSAGVPALPILPVRTLEIRSASLDIDYEGYALAIPLSAIIELPGDAPSRVQARLELFGIPADVHGVMDPVSGGVSLGANFSLPPVTVEPECLRSPAEQRRLPPASAVIQLEARWEGGADIPAWGRVSLRADTPGFDGTSVGLPVGLGETVLAFRGSLDENRRLKDIACELRIDTAFFRNTALDNLILSVPGGGDPSVLSVRINKPLQAAVVLEASHDPIENLAGVGPFEGTAEWRIDGTVPSRLIRLISGGALLSDDSFPFEAQGTLSGLLVPFQDRRIEGRVLESAMGPVTVSLPEEALRVGDLLLRGGASFRLDAGSFGAALEAGSILETGTIRIGSNRGPIVVDPLHIKARSGDVLVAGLSGGTGPLTASASAVFTKPLRVRINKDALLFSSVSFDGTAHREPGEVLCGSARFTLDGGSLSIAEPAIRAEEISLHVPLATGSRPAEQGTLSVGAVRFEGIERPGPELRFFSSGRQYRLDGSWNLFPPTPVRLFADLSLDRGILQGTGRAAVDWFDLPDMKEFGVLIPALRDLELSGQVRASADVTVAGTAVTPDIVVSCNDLHIASRRQDLEVSGISGSVRVDRLAPLSTPGNQVLTVERLRLGAFEAVQGLLAFRLEDRDRLFLEKTTWAMPQGGTIALQSSRFDLGARKVALEAYLENIDLIALLSRITDDRIGGSGRVHGRIPLSYETGRLTMGSGYLYAVPGAGYLQIRDDQWMKTLMLYVNEALSGHPYLSTVAERMEEALRSFEYSYLTVDLGRVGRETGARIEVRGRGLKGDPPQEIGSLVLNVNDLDELVNRVLGFTLSGEESIERALEDLLDFR